MYQLTIGLEIHLKVKSPRKLFCPCENTQEMDSLTPNTTICPICTGQPGALPILQLPTLEQSLLMGKILECSINKESQFDRKSYFYPDLPMGYQITQFFKPTMTGGQLRFFHEDFEREETIRIRQIQMETDTAKSIHTENSSLLDYNRAWTPLIEIVTEPDFHTAEQVGAFLKELQRIARYNNISDADMEKWQMRVDVNVSISDTDEFGARNEIKNMNSISAIMIAIEHEYQRQVAVLQSGGEIEQATRRRDTIENTSHVMRSKENELDYRYFPDPDLPPLNLTQAILQKIDSKSLTLPYNFIKEARTKWWFSKEYINTLIHDKAILDYFQACLADWCDANETVKWIAWPISAYLNENFLSISELKFDRQQFVWFLQLVEQAELISNHYKLIMDEMIKSGEDARTIIDRLGLQSWGNEDELLAIIQKVIDENQSVVEQYRGWKETAIWFFIGQVMKASQWKADPNKVKQMLIERLS